MKEINKREMTYETSAELSPKQLETVNRLLQFFCQDERTDYLLKFKSEPNKITLEWETADGSGGHYRFIQWLNRGFKLK